MLIKGEAQNGDARGEEAERDTCSVKERLEEGDAQWRCSKKAKLSEEEA